MGPIAAWEENLLGKQFPTFCPLGPAVVTADEIPDPHDVHIQTRLNGTVVQDARTSDLVFGVAELIAYYSRFYALRPGDVISTGSPSGVGFARDPKVFMESIPFSATRVYVEQVLRDTEIYRQLSTGSPHFARCSTAQLSAPTRAKSAGHREQ